MLGGITFHNLAPNLENDLFSISMILKLVYINYL